MVNMTRQKQQYWMKLTAATLMVVSLLVLLMGVLLPVKTEAVEAETQSLMGTNAAGAGTATPPAKTTTIDRVDLAALLKVARVNWQRPVFAEGGDDELAAGDGSGLPMSLRLVGVVYEPGHSMAIFQRQDGSMEVCPVGQMVDDAGGNVKVTRVEVDRAVVVFGGVTQTLMVPMQTEASMTTGVGAAGGASTTAAGGATAGSTVGTTRRPLPPELQKRLDEIRANRAKQKAAGASTPQPTTTTNDRTNTGTPHDTNKTQDNPG